MEPRQLRKPALILLVCWLGVFVVGFMAKVVYESFNGPEWLNSVVVATCIGLDACVMYSVGIRYLIAKWKDRSVFSKLWGLIVLLLFTPFFLLGLLALWQGLSNFIALISLN
jgi:hypothetical protein